MKISSPHDLAVAVRSRRQDLGLTQAELASQAGVSRLWLNQIEGGKPTAEFGLVIRLLDALGLRLELTGDDARGGDALPRSRDLDKVLRDYRNR